MKRETAAYFGMIALFLTALAALSTYHGWAILTPWAVPAVLLFFFLAYEFDVKLPTLGSMNVDHVIVFPAVVLFQNPLVVGLLAGTGLVASRIYRRGLRGMRPVQAFDALHVAISVTAGGWLFLALSPPLRDSPPLWLALLVISMTLTSFFQLGAVLLQRALLREAILPGTVLRFSGQTVLWILLSTPFVALVMGAVLDQRPLDLLLSGASLLIIIWALRLNADLNTKNAALTRAQKRQEFLQRLSSTTVGSLEQETFLTDLLKGLKEFVSWDHELLLVFPPEKGGDPILLSLGDLPADPHGAKDTLMGMLEDPALRKPRVVRGDELVPLLLPGASAQAAVSLATAEVAYGVLVLERQAGARPFAEEEMQFLDLAMTQIAQHVQDEILKKQLLATNRRLLKQTEYLSQILQISNLLKVHLDVQGILEKVALGIRESIGFHTVLISLYHEEEGFFERMAMAGDEERWEEIRAVRPPAEVILNDLQEKYRVGNCYFVSHTEATVTPYDVMPSNPRTPREPSDWDPMDALFVPLLDKDNRLLGIFSVDEPADGKIPSLETLQALEVLANQTVHALESARVHAQIKRQAVLDGLTGLYNHGYFQETVALQAREHVEGKRQYSILMMDLDNFKEINDSFGHIAGDSVLKAVAQALNASIRKEDIAARYGGEEFALFLPDRTAQQARPIADRIRAAVEQITVFVEGVPEPVGVTLSIGLASYPDEGVGHAEVLERADEALYRAKREGKNRVAGG